MAKSRRSTKKNKSNSNVVKIDTNKNFTEIKNMFASKKTDYISTGISILDTLLGGGLPRGKFVSLSSKSGIGKTTLMVDIARNVCANGYKVHWWDFEHALETSLKCGVGLNEFESNPPEESDLFVHLEPVTYGDAEQILESLDEQTIPAVIIVDSEAAMCVDWQRDVSITSQKPGEKARIASNFFNKYKSWIKIHNVCIVFINQVRMRFNFSGISREVSADGNAFKFAMDVRLEMKRIKDLTRKEITMEGEIEIPFGTENEIYAVKNRNVRSYINFKLPLIFGRGVSKLLILQNILSANNYITVAGGWYTVNIPEIDFENIKCHGSAQLYKFLKDNMEILEKFIEENNLIFLVKEVKEKDETED